MKRNAFAGIVLSVFIIGSFSGCGKQTDPDVLMREAKANAGELTSCTASIKNTLEFTVDGQQKHYQTENNVTYQAKPFALKSVQTAKLDQADSNSTTYNLSDTQGIWFYSQSDGVWQKTSAGSIDTTPFHQIDILRLLEHVKGQKYVREVNLGAGKAHKLELTFKSEVLRSTVENIVTATGIGNGSSTIVQALLDSADDIYGYCYIDEKTGQIAQLELDATQALNKVFQNIDGSSVKIIVTKCMISGKIDNIGMAPAVKLPAEAANAQTVEAHG